MRTRLYVHAFERIQYVRIPLKRPVLAEIFLIPLATAIPLGGVAELRCH